MSNLEQEMLLGFVTDETIIEAEQKLSSEEFQRYSFMAETNKKSEVIAWLLWIFLGRLQIHLVYLNQFNSRNLKVLRIVGLVLLYFVIGWFILFPLWIYDAFKMSSYIKASNNMEKAKILSLYMKRNNPQGETNDTGNYTYTQATSDYNDVKVDPIIVNEEVVEENEDTINVETIIEDVTPEVVDESKKEN